MKKPVLLKKSICLILSALMLVAVGLGLAYAEDATQSIINDSELTDIIEGYLDEHNISEKNFSLGFCYTETGDTWYYNGDTWFYPASVYKIPLMMLLSEQVAAGELSQEDKISGLDVSTIEQYILTYSNNDWAHIIRTYLGGDAVWRQEVKKYSTLTENEYDPDYMDHCYFSNRYITEVLKTLFYEPERFPNITECLLAAEPTHYFRLSMEGQYDIAQKYGSYEDSYGRKFNHTVGIVYRDKPCIISVMTCNVDGYEKVISDVARLVTEYSAGLDDKLAEYTAALEAAKEEQARIEAEKAAELEREQAQAKEQAQAEQPSAQKQPNTEQQAYNQNAPKRFGLTFAIVVGVVLALLAAAGFAILIAKGRRGEKRRDDYSRRRDAEQREKKTPERTVKQSTKKTAGRNGGYKPKH